MADPVTLAAIFTAGKITTGIIVASILVNVAIAAVLGKLLEPNIPQDSRDVKGLQTTIKSSIAPRRVIYGEAIVGGPYIIMETIGNNNSQLRFVVALAGHPIEDVLGVYVEDQYIDISGPGGATNTSALSNDLDANYITDIGTPFKNNIRFVKNLGWGYADLDYVTDGFQQKCLDDRARSVIISDAYANGFDESWKPPRESGIVRDSGTGLYTDGTQPVLWGDKLTNIAHIFVDLEFDRDIFNGFPSLRFHVKGKPLYNPQQDSTNFAAEGADSAGTHVLENPDTYEYSEDWTLCVLDYLMNSDYGLGAKTTGILNEINWSEAIESYIISSELITNGLDTPDTGLAPRYTINGVFETGNTPISTMEAMLTSGAGSLVYAQGQYKIRPGVYRLPNSENDIINEDMIISSLSIKTHASRSEVFNKAAGIFVNIGYDPSSPIGLNNQPQFISSDFPVVDPIDSSGLNPYELEDGEEIIKNFDYPFTTRSFEAQRLSRIQLERVRRGLSISFVATLEVLKYSVGDTVYLEILSNSKYANEAFFNRLGLDDTVQDRPDSPFTSYYKQFKIINMDYAEDFGIQVTLLEESPDIYDWNEGFALPDDSELVAAIIADSFTSDIIPPTFVVASPDVTINEVVASNDIQTRVKWTAPDRGSVVNALDRAQVVSYILEYGIVDNPSAPESADRVGQWISAGSYMVQDTTLTVQGPISINNIYIDPTTQYDFRVRSVLYSGQRSAWAYYSEDILSDFSPQVPVGAVRYYIKPTNGTQIKNSTGTLTAEAREVTGFGDNLIASGDIRLYVNDNTEVTVANGFASPSDGFTGTFDSGDITGSIVVELRDGPGGLLLDTQTFVDVLDGDDGQFTGNALNLGRRFDDLNLWYNEVTATTPLAAPWTLFTDVTNPVWDTGLSITGSTVDTMFSELVPVDNTRKYRLSVWLRQQTGDRLTTLFVTQFDINKNVINGTTSAATGWTTKTISHFLTHDSITVGTSWAKYTFEFGGDATAEFDAACQFVSIGSFPLEAGSTSTTLEYNDFHIVEVANDGISPVLYYIKPTEGTAIRNSSGQLTIEAHIIENNIDSILSAGTIQLFDPSNAVVEAPTYVSGSDGYTGILDSSNINGDIVITLKDGAGGTPLDTITLVDITDGSSAVSGFIEATNGLAWTYNPNTDAWDPASLTTDLECTFVKEGVDVARIAVRVTNDGTGLLTSALTPHSGGNLNAGTLATASNFNSNSNAITVEFTYVNGSDQASVSEVVLSVSGGINALHMEVVPLGTTFWIKDGSAGAWNIGGSNDTSDVDVKVFKGSTEVARIAKRVNRDINGTLTDLGTIIHSDGSNLNPGTISTLVKNASANFLSYLFTYTSGSDTVTASSPSFGTNQNGNTIIGPAGAAAGFIRINTSTFAGASGSTPGAMFIHGSDETGVPSGTDPAEINYNGVIVDVPAEDILTSQPVEQGYIIFDSAGTAGFVGSSTSGNLTGARLTQTGGIIQWQYDNDTTWVDFTPSADDLIIGKYSAQSANNIFQASFTQPIPLSSEIINVGRIEAASIGAINATIGFLETREEGNPSTNTTPRLVLQDTTTPMVIFGTDDDTVLFSLTELEDSSLQLSLRGDFQPNTLDTADAFSEAGIENLRGRLGVIAPSGGDLRGGYLFAGNIALTGAAQNITLEGDSPSSIPTAIPGTFDLSYRVTDFSNLNETVVPGSWTLEFQYSDDGGSNWTTVPGTSKTLTGTVTFINSPPIIYYYNLDQTRNFTWSPSSPIADGDLIEFRVAITAQSGYSSVPKLASAVAEQEISGSASGASDSFAIQEVTDTDAGYTWSATGTTTANGAADTLTWVSGTDIDIDVDSTNRAIRVAYTGAGGGATDHGALTGLGDNDHPQYPLIAGSPTISGSWVFEATSGNTSLIIRKVTATNQAKIRFESEAAIERWSFGITALANDDFFLARYNEAGAFQDAPIYVTGDDGIVSFPNRVDVDGGMLVSSITGPVTLNDNVDIQFGTGNDAQISSDGIDLRIDLSPGSDMRVIGGSTGTDSMISAFADGSVWLWYDGAARIRTTLEGATIDGALLLEEIAAEPANVALHGRIWTSNIDGSLNYQNDGTGQTGKIPTLDGSQGNTRVAVFDANGQLTGDSALTWSGTNQLILTGGQILAYDNVNITLGTGDDIDMYSNGTDIYNDLAPGVNWSLRGGAANDQAIVYQGDGGVFIYYNGTLQIQTTFNGPIIDGAVYVLERAAAAANIGTYGQLWTSSVDGSLNYQNDGTGQTGKVVTTDGSESTSEVAVFDANGQLTGDPAFLWSASNNLTVTSGRFYAYDNVNISLGTTLDVDMYSDGLDIYHDMAPGFDWFLRGGAANDRMIACFADNLVATYHNGVLCTRTATLANGALEVDNRVTASGFERVLTVSDGPQKRVKTADQVKTDNTLADDTHLTGITLVAGARYQFELFVRVSCASTLPDISLSLNFTNAVQSGFVVTRKVNGTSETTDTSTTISGGKFFEVDTTGINIIKFEGSFHANATTGGTMKLQWSQNVTSGNAVTLHNGSYLTVEKL